MDKTLNDQYGSNCLKVNAATEKNNLKQQEALASMTKSASGISTNTKTKETVVTIQNGEKGCYFSRLQVAVFMSAFLLTICVVVVLVLCFGNNATHITHLTSTEDNECQCSENLVTHTERVSEETPLPYVITDESHTSADEANLGVRLSRAIEPLHYDIDLNVQLKNTSYTGSVVMLVHMTSSTRFVVFHVKPFLLQIVESEVYVTPVSEIDNPINDAETEGSGMSIRHEKDNTNTDDVVDDGDQRIVKQFHDYKNELHVIEMKKPLKKGHLYKININLFRGYILGDLKGIYLSSYKGANGEKRYLAASQLQSTDARKVFPCFDEPDMKATFSVTMTHSAEYTALSNMPVESEQCVDDCTKTRVKFQTTPKMSTYLLAFVVSDFKYKEKILPNNYTLRVWAMPDMVNQTQYALDFASKTYAYFTDYFQISDVVPKSDHVAVPDFSGGAMENWGLVIYRETALLYDPEVSSSSNKFMVTLIVAHEIAHTWFGNMVTMKWWDDLWLNEGFASTLMYFAMDHVYPEWHVLDIVVVEDMFPVMVKDALETSHPVSPKIDHPDEIAESFDQISYNKGMAVLRMLKSFLGSEGFRLGLQTYITKYKFQNAEMSELWQTFTEATNSTFAIGEIMDTWTRQMGYPVITITTEGDFYRLEQERFLINRKVSETQEESVYGYKWHVPFTYRLEGGTETHLQWLKMGPGRIKKNSEGWLLGNIHCDGFYRINYEVDMWQKLAQQLNNDNSVFGGANRACLIGDAFNLARASMLDYAVALNLTTYLHNEESYVPWKAFLSSLEFIRGMLSKQSAYVLLEKYIRDLVSPVFKKIGTDETGTLPEMYLRRKLLRTGCDVGVKDAIKYAKDKFAAWMLNGTRLPTDFSQVIYAVGIREGSVEEWDYVWTKSQTTNSPSEREMMLEALAHTQKPWLLWRYANWIFDVNKIKMQDVRLVMSYFSNTPLGRMIALHFLMTRWDDLNEQFGDDTFIIREMIGEVTVYVNSDFELKQLDSLFTEKPPKGAKKGADSALALIRANINWMKMNYKSIATWLEQHVESSF